MVDHLLLREVEQFLFNEAQLLDDWKLLEWEALFTDEGRYNIPPLNTPEAEVIESGQYLFLAHDDRRMIAARVERMLKKKAYVETPRSNILHSLTNICILDQSQDRLYVSSNFQVFRARRGQTSHYFGRVFHRLQRRATDLYIEEKRVCLSNDLLQPQGSIGIIL